MEYHSVRQPLTWFLDNGCELQKPDQSVLVYIYQMSGGIPCTDCNCKDTCPAWPKLPSNIATPKQKHKGPICPKCKSPLNMVKVMRRGGKCACGEKI